MLLGKRKRIFVRTITAVWFAIFDHWGFGQTKNTAPNSGPEACLTLSDAVNSALNTSETIKVQQYEAAISAEQLAEAKGAILPSVKATAAISRLDESQNTARSKTEAYPTTAKLSLTQPIYAGGAEYAAMDKTAMQADASSKLADAARIRLARDVVAKAYQMLLAQSELRSSADLRELSRRRAKEIRGRAAIGRSKPVDALGADVQIANSDAQFEAARLGLETIKRQLSSLIGQPITNICTFPTESQKNLIAWEEVQEKVLQRPDVRAAKLFASAAGETVAIARAGHKPSLDFAANYYLKRPDAQKNLGKWDLTLSAAIPIYSGGMVSSRVNAAVALEQKQSAIANQTSQSAMDEARELWESYTTGRAQVTSLEDAAKKSAQYYQATINDERKGLATSLETLQALNSFIDAQRASQRAKIKFDETLRQIQLVTGDIEGAVR